MTFEELRAEVGTSEAVRAKRIADARFDGDLNLGRWWVHAAALAIHVKGGPEARAKWNDDYAR